MIRTYSELTQISTFRGRFDYLRLNGQVAGTTFGASRYLGQELYHSQEWRDVRDYVIIRDEARDLAMEGHDIFGRVYVHHMNPVTPGEIEDRESSILDPEYLVAVSFDTHQAIHYGDDHLLAEAPPERRPNDTSPWRSQTNGGDGLWRTAFSPR